MVLSNYIYYVSVWHGGVIIRTVYLDQQVAVQLSDSSTLIGLTSMCNCGLPRGGVLALLEDQSSCSLTHALCVVLPPDKQSVRLLVRDDLEQIFQCSHKGTDTLWMETWPGDHIWHQTGMHHRIANGLGEGDKHFIYPQEEHSMLGKCKIQWLNLFYTCSKLLHILHISYIS